MCTYSYTRWPYRHGFILPAAFTDWGIAYRIMKRKNLLWEKLLRKTYHQRNSAVISQSRLTCPSTSFHSSLPFLKNKNIYIYFPDCQKLIFFIHYIRWCLTVEVSILVALFLGGVQSPMKAKKLNDITREIRSISVDHRHAAIHRPEEEEEEER